MGERRDLGTGEQRRLAFVGAVVRQQDLLEHGSLLLPLFRQQPSRSISARSLCSVSRAYFA